MEQMAFQNIEPKKSRADKIRDAKLSFHSQAEHTRFFQPVDNETELTEPFPEEKRHSFFYRMLTAVMLFCVLVTAFHFDFSYKGWNKNKLEKVLSDDTHYQKIIQKAAQVMKRIEPKK